MQRMSSQNQSAGKDEMNEVAERADPLAHGTPHSGRWSASWPLALGALTVALLIVLAATGWFAGAVASDTETYRVALVWPGAFAELRHPLYGLLLRLFDPIESHLMAIAISQTACHVIAVAVLFGEARRFGLGNPASFALAAAALVSQSFLFHGRLVLPEAPAVSAMLIAFAATLRWAGSATRAWLALCGAGLFAGVAMFLRPVFLAAVVVLPVVTLLLSFLRGRPGALTRAVWMVVAVAMPFLVQSGIRAATVGDFNIVSFGGAQMAATAGLMIEPQHIERFPPDIRPTAQEVLRLRTEAETAGRIYATPLNSANTRSFLSAAVGYFDIYARMIDTFAWVELARMRQPDESWISFNKRMQAFSLATLRIVPERWLAWTIGGTSRFVGRALVTNAVFAFCAIACLLVGAWRLLQGRQFRGSIPPQDWLVVAILAAGWAVNAITAPILVAFPTTRYIDTAAVLIPSLAIMALIAVAKDFVPRARPPGHA
jgi:hypothetical protein